MQPAAKDALRRARYRARQFFRGVRPHLSPSEVAEARTLLSTAEFALFLHAEPRDRRHSVDLLHRLRSDAASRARPLPADLEVAALVHDIGKGPLLSWHRVAFVLLEAVAPALARRLARPDSRGWRGALWRLRQHARLGAEALAAAGSASRVVEVTRRHTGPPPRDDPDLAWFIQADDRV
jgi:hypothetical protein